MKRFWLVALLVLNGILLSSAGSRAAPTSTMDLLFCCQGPVGEEYCCLCCLYIAGCEECEGIG